MYSAKGLAYFILHAVCSYVFGRVFLVGFKHERSKKLPLITAEKGVDYADNEYLNVDMSSLYDSCSESGSESCESKSSGIL